MTSPLLLAALLAISACGPKGPVEAPDAGQDAGPSAAELELEARLAHLEARLEQARIDEHIPGMAVAVVKDGELIFAEGFGVKDIDAQTPVTPETVFAIGSSTKAFSSTLAAMMVDEGKLRWDDPASQHLEGFELGVDGKEGEVATIRDLLAHRSGFARMGILWAGATVPRDEVLAYAVKARPVAPFRKEFHYNNVTYMAGAIAAARVAGTQWEELVRERLLEPLHMDHSHVDYRSTLADPQVSKGYTWRSDLEEFELEEFRNTDVIAPAGAIYSSVLDMSNWLRLQLAEGEFEGERLVSAEALAETHTAQIEIGPGIDYGMGWMLREWEGRKVVEHGGNIDGFSASVALMPEEGLGMVMLTNVGMTSLQEQAMMMVWSAMLTDDYLPKEVGDGAEFAAYVGNYAAEIPGFGDEPFQVLVKDGKLAVDVPGQTVYVVKAPDDDGWRVFEATDTVAISFDEDAKGEVIALRLHQGGMSFELLREGVVLEPELSAEEAAPYLGSYRDEDSGKSARVLLHNGRLAVDVPGQMVFDLEPPDAQGDRHFRVKYDISVSFTMGEGKRAGEVVDLRIAEPGGGRVFTHEAKPKSAPTLSTEALHKARKSERRAKAMAKAGVVHMRQKIEFINAGVTGAGDLWFDAEGRLRQDNDFGGLGKMTVVLVGGDGWSESAFDPLKALEGVELLQTINSHPRVMYGDWREHFDSETLVSTETVDGREIYVVEARLEGLPPSRLRIDAKTGDVIEIRSAEVMGSGMRIPMTLVLSDYRKVGGMRVPFRVETRSRPTGTTVVTLESVDVKVGEDPARFVAMPKRD